MTTHEPACAPVPGAPPATARAAARHWLEEGTWHIDVRGLPPPQPLVSILRLVQGAQRGASIVVHHDRDPVLLYPQLAEIGWEAVPAPAPPGEVRLLLRALT